MAELKYCQNCKQYTGVIEYQGISKDGYKVFFFECGNCGERHFFSYPVGDNQ
jgi:RNase P subunit RPR2